MSWTHSNLHEYGVLPYWSCDSCTTMKDKTCSVIHNLRAELSRAQVRINGKQGQAQFPAQKEQLAPLFETVERICRWSGINQQERKHVA